MELTKASIAVATSFTLASFPGASGLSYQYEPLRASLSKTQRLRKAQKSKPNPDPKETRARCAELEWSLELFKPLVLEQERDLAALKAERAKLLGGLVYRYKTKGFDQATTL